MDVISSNGIPWDFRGKRFENAQRGTGGYYLCGNCNHLTGRETVPHYLEFIKQTKSQNVFPLEFDGAASLRWSMTLTSVRPHAIGQQVLLMIACMNGYRFMGANPDIARIITDNNYCPRGLTSRIYMFINSGAISISYPVTAVLRKGGDTGLVTGVHTGTFSFQLETNGLSNVWGYLDITDWVTDYSYEDEADLDLSVPIFQTNVGLPGVHASRQEILAQINQR
jgi:hypothetical protein